MRQMPLQAAVPAKEAELHHDLLFLLFHHMLAAEGVEAELLVGSGHPCPKKTAGCVHVGQAALGSAPRRGASM